MKVRVSVMIGYDMRSVTLNEKQWQKVMRGKPFAKSVRGSYEGQSYWYRWHFNGDLYKDSNLVVTYDGGGVGFIGNLSEANVDHLEESEEQ